MVVKFDLSAIPTGASILSATLTLYAHTVTGLAGGTVVINPLEQSWIESEVTWNSRQTGTSWGTLGGTIDTSNVMASKPIGDIEASEHNEFPMTTSEIQGWVSNPSTNRGFVVRFDIDLTPFYNDTASEVVFKSAEGYDHWSTFDKVPKLEVIYQN